MDTFNELYSDIETALKHIEPCAVYREDIPPNAAGPCFLVKFTVQSPVRGMNGRLKNKVSVTVVRTPQNAPGTARVDWDTGENPVREGWDVGQDLARGFRLNRFKMRNRSLNMEDKKLHMKFDVPYQEFWQDDAPDMQTLSQQTKLKEE